MDADRLRAMWPFEPRDSWMAPEYEPGLASVIVPVFQRADLVTRSLDSVYAQTYRPLELVVVDDGSTDGTAATVAAWSEALPPDPEFTLRLVDQANAGPPAARNTGLRQCAGEFIQFFDSDDLLHPEKIRMQAGRLAGDDRLDATYGRTACFVDVPDWEARPYVTFPGPDDGVLGTFLTGGCWLPASALFRRSTCAALGPWDEAAPILEDWDYSIRLILGDAKLDFRPDTVLLYRHDFFDRPTVTGCQYSPRSLRGRCLLTVKWVDWIRAAGQLDPVLAQHFSTQLFELAIASLEQGQAAIGREILRSLRRLHLDAPPLRRAEPAYSLVAELPEWCSPALLQALRRSVEFKDLTLDRLTRQRGRSAAAGTSHRSR